MNYLEIIGLIVGGGFMVTGIVVLLKAIGTLVGSLLIAFGLLLVGSIVIWQIMKKDESAPRINNNI